MGGQSTKITIIALLVVDNSSFGRGLDDKERWHKFTDSFTDQVLDWIFCLRCRSLGLMLPLIIGDHRIWHSGKFQELQVNQL